MSRFPSGATMSFGPGPLTPVIKMLVITNVVMFVLSKMAPVITLQLGLVPSAVFGSLAIWQPVTYLFLHGDVMHILFNMLALWMFGTEFERMWGSRFFAKYYFVTGIGAGVVTLGVSLWSDSVYYAVTIGASGAIYGILLAYGMYFPNRPILIFLLFPVPAKYAVIIFGLITLYFAYIGSGSSVAHWAHLGGLVVGYVYLKGLRVRPFDEIKYRWLKWKMQRARSKFDVHRGGRSDDEWKSDWKKHIH